MFDRVGQQIGNDRLLHFLGSFADVFLGEHLYLKAPAAIKFLRTKVITKDDLDAFLKEAQTIARLNHPNIIRVTDFGVDQDIPFLVMDYAPNGTLRQRHPKGSVLPVSTVVPYVRQIADALHHAHEEKIIHRDVKPENMLVGRRNEVLLSDFGIALIAQSSRYQTTQEMVGTVAYMPPEQIQGKARPTSDLYALGIVTYEWLSGDRSFHGSFIEICTRQMYSPLLPLRNKVPTVATEVEQVVTTALAKDYRQRFANVQAFAIALEIASRSVWSQPTTVSQQIPAQMQLPSPTITPSINMQDPQEQVKTFLIDRVSSTPACPALPERIPEPSQYKISRRAVIAGLAAAGLAAAGGIAWWLRSASSVSHLSSASPPPSHLPYVYRGHSLSVTAVAWSPDGKRIASASRDGTVQVWDAVDGGHIFTYFGHDFEVNAVAWSPDGKRIASAGYDYTVQVWDASDGGHAFTYRGHRDRLGEVAWSPDSTRIASASIDKTVQVWSPVAGSHAFIYRGHNDKVWAVAWSLQGARLASASLDKTVQVWNAADGGNIYVYRGHMQNVTAVAWSPDSTHIASGSDDKTVQVWEAK
jgi:serine/threonine protein kinase